MAQIVWLPQMSLGIPEVDSAHKAFLLALEQTASTADEAFSSRLFALIARLEQDFREEEDVMEATGFPGLLCYREQHARALAALHHAVPKVMAGDIALGRQAVALLGQWFLHHLTTMDAAFADTCLRAHRDVQQGHSASRSP